MARPRSKKTYLDFIIREYGFDNDFSEEPVPDDVAALRDLFEDDQLHALYTIGFSDAKDWYSPSLKYLHRLAYAFVGALAHLPDLEVLREKATLQYGPEIDKLAKSVPFIPGSEHVSRQWVVLLWERLLGIYRSEISRFDGTVELYLAGLSSDIHAPGRIFFHLVERRQAEKEQDGFDFAFMATYSPDQDGSGTPKPHLPLKYALEEYRDDNRKMISLLSSLNKVSEKSTFIGGLMDSGELFHPLGFTPSEAFIFLKEVPLYEDCGILCRIPNWWKHQLPTALKLDFKTGGFMSIDSLLTCIPELSIDGIPFSREEIEQLLNMSEGLAMLKGRWIEVNHERIRGLLKVLESQEKNLGEGMTFAEAFRLSLGMNRPAESDNEEIITNSQWISDAFAESRKRVVRDFKVPRTFKGKLRPYQDTGVKWLAQLSDLGFGACLADDMGLGKTAQVLAFLENFRRKAKGHGLLVAPASLVNNWEKEISKFTPSMDYSVFSSSFPEISNATLTITTYGMLSRHKELAEREWDVAILDEAQAIKNPNSKQSKIARSIRAGFRIALTGTPVENELNDLWSIFDFTNPGLLGSKAEFERYSANLTETGDYERLRSMTAPFILRRMKTDRSIISDLPDKIETNEIITLSKKQRVLYNKVAEDFADALSATEKGQRLGLILSTITKFKQLCNHPSQYLGQKAYPENESGKFQMLRELCESIRDSREKVLVFTQYREMTEPLAGFLSQVFGRNGLVFHGGLTKKARAEVVERFESNREYIPFMVISIKAGGTGLNLVSANHVIHFDRWWNPAVENQATDRAFRIGQTKNVMVHKFVCQGTMEEKIDAMINSKVELAENVIGAGESWISKMNDDELVDLFRLEGAP